MEYFYPFGETVRRLVQQDRTPKHVFVLGVNILSYGKIGAFQEPLGASSSEESLVVVEVGEFDQTL